MNAELIALTDSELENTVGGYVDSSTPIVDGYAAPYPYPYPDGSGGGGGRYDYSAPVDYLY